MDYICLKPKINHCIMQFNDKERKSLFEKDSQFWDRLVKGLFISGLAIIFFAVIAKWLGLL